VTDTARNLAGATVEGAVVGAPVLVVVAGVVEVVVDDPVVCVVVDAMGAVVDAMAAVLGALLRPAEEHPAAARARTTQARDAPLTMTNATRPARPPVLPGAPGQATTSGSRCSP